MHTAKVLVGLGVAAFVFPFAVIVQAMLLFGALTFAGVNVGDNATTLLMALVLFVAVFASVVVYKRAERSIERRA